MQGCPDAEAGSWRQVMRTEGMVAPKRKVLDAWDAAYDKALLQPVQGLPVLSVVCCRGS